MDTKEIIATVSSSIAALSLIANVLLAIAKNKADAAARKAQAEAADALRKTQKAEATRDEVVESLRLVLQHLERSRFFDVDPDKEIWDYGFRSLEVLADLCSTAHVLVQHSTVVERDLRETISELHDRVKALRSLRDSYSTHAHSKTDAPAHIQTSWEDWERAKRGLENAHPTVQKCKRLISEFLRNQVA